MDFIITVPEYEDLLEEFTFDQIESFVNAVQAQDLTNLELFNNFPGITLLLHGYIPQIKQSILLDRLSTVDERTVQWIHGPTGSGKTHLVYDTHEAGDIISIISYADLKRYVGERVILLDLFDADDPMELDNLIKIIETDVITIDDSVDIKIVATHIYICSWKSPEIIYPDNYDELVGHLDQITQLTVT